MDKKPKKAAQATAIDKDISVEKPEAFPHISIEHFTKDPNECPQGMRLKIEVALYLSLGELHSRMETEAASGVGASESQPKEGADHKKRAAADRKRLLCYFLAACHSSQRSKAWNIYLELYQDKFQQILTRILYKYRDWPLVRGHEEDIRQNALVGVFEALIKANNVLEIEVLNAWVCGTLRHIVSKSGYILSKTGTVERLPFGRASDNSSPELAMERAGSQDTDMVDSEDELIARLDEKRNLENLQIAISQLVSDDRTLIELYLRGLTQQEIGVQLVTSAPTVNRELKKIFQKLRRRLSN